MMTWDNRPTPRDAGFNGRMVTFLLGFLLGFLFGCAPAPAGRTDPVPEEVCVTNAGDNYPCDCITDSECET